MVQQLSLGNGHVWSACYRGLIETFGAAVYLDEKPDSVVALVQHGIKAGKLRAAAETGCSGMANDLDRLNAIVHPGGRSVFAGAKVTNETTREVYFRLGLDDFDADDIEEGATVTRNICTLVLRRLETLLDGHPELLSAGKVIATWPDDDVAAEPDAAGTR